MLTKKPTYVMTYTNPVHARGYLDLLAKMTRSEIRTFSHIFKNIHYGNICYESQADICKELNAYPSHMSTGIKHMIDLGIMRKYKHGFMLNPEYFVVGSLDDCPKLHAMYKKLECNPHEEIEDGKDI